MSPKDGLARSKQLQYDPQKQALWKKAVARYGGWQLWRELESVHLGLLDLRGWLPRLKGVLRTSPQLLSGQAVIRVFPHLWMTLFEGFPTASQFGVFWAGQVGIFDKGETLLSFPPEEHRQRFRGLQKLRPWSALDVLYFFGCALCTYTSVPFSLAGLESLPAPRADEIRVRFPPGSHTHGAVQSFYFDDEGLLFRHDYHAEILGPLAHGCHYTSLFVEVGGLPIPSHRLVKAGPFGLPLPIDVLEAHLLPLSVTFRPGPPPGPPAPRSTPTAASGPPDRGRSGGAP